MKLKVCLEFTKPVIQAEIEVGTMKSLSAFWLGNVSRNLVESWDVKQHKITPNELHKPKCSDVGVELAKMSLSCLRQIQTLGQKNESDNPRVKRIRKSPISGGLPLLILSSNLLFPIDPLEWCTLQGRAHSTKDCCICMQ